MIYVNTSRLKNNFVSDPIYSRADTLRVDSIVNWIDEFLADQKGDRIVAKNFPCENSLDSGSVTIYYQGKNVVVLGQPFRQ